MNARIRFHLLFPFTFRGRKDIKAMIVSLFKKEKKELETLDYIFCSDEYLLQMNRDFLQHDYYTDVISFDLSGPEPGSKTTGEIYISIERVRENALLLGQSMQQELKRVMIHGALHLCGYKDTTKAERAKMTRKENYYLDL